METANYPFRKHDSAESPDRYLFLSSAGEQSPCTQQKNCNFVVKPAHLLVEQRIKILGYASLLLGIISALLCVVPFGVFFALITGFFGMIVSSIYIYLDTKHEINNKKFTIGIWGMVLSSLPVLLLLAIIILSKIN